MAAKRLTMGVKGVRGLLKVLNGGIEKLKRYGNWTSRSCDITDFMYFMTNITSKNVIFQDGGQTVDFVAKDNKDII